MNKSHSLTIEQALFQRMGISVDDAIATGTDFIDEKISQAVQSGTDVDASLSSVNQVLEKLLQPSTLTALGQLLDSLPQLARLASLANQIPDILATLSDVLEDYQSHCSDKGIDIEKALTNGLQSALWLGSNVDPEHLRRIGDLLSSDILNPHAVSVVNNAAQSLTHAQQQACDSPTQDRIGMFGLLSALRNPEVQRSLAFAVQFGKCFGKNLENNET